MSSPTCMPLLIHTTHSFQVKAFREDINFTHKSVIHDMNGTMTALPYDPSGNGKPTRAKILNIKVFEEVYRGGTKNLVYHVSSFLRHFSCV